MSATTPTSTIGAHHEHLVVADLYRQLFSSVFRNCSAVGPVDLIAIKRGSLIRIQVKSRRNQDRAVFKRNDVLAVVSDGTVSYRVRSRRIARHFQFAKIVKRRRL